MSTEASQRGSGPLSTDRVTGRLRAPAPVEPLSDTSAQSPAGFMRRMTTGRIQRRDDPFLSRRSATLEHLAKSPRHHHKLGCHHRRRYALVCLQLEYQPALCDSDQLDTGCDLSVDGSTPLSLLRDLVEPREDSGNRLLRTHSHALTTDRLTKHGRNISRLI